MHRLLALTLTIAPTLAHALGGVAGQDAEATLSASRSVVIRSEGAVQLITQIKYDGAPSAFAWVIPLPDANPDDGVVINTAFDQAALDDLEAATAPTFEGACDGAPNGERATFSFRESFGPLPAQAPGQRIFRRAELEDAKTYIGETLGYTLSDSLSAAMDAAADRNYMFAVVNVPLGGVARVDPILSATYPTDGGNPQLSLRLAAAGLDSNSRADMLMWIFDTGRVRANLTTREVDFESVAFVSSLQTNYDAIFEDTVDALQSQALVVEYADEVASAGLDDATFGPLLEGTGATWVTRLRARFQEPALRNNAATLSLRLDDEIAAYGAAHTVTGSACGGEADMGPAEADMGLTEDDMGPADMGPAEADMGLDGGVEPASGGGDDGGCSAASGRSSTPFLLLTLILFGARLSRRRR